MKIPYLYKITFLLTFLVSIFLSTQITAQDRFDAIEKKLSELADTITPGLKEKVDISVSGVSIQEFLRGLAESNNLNISIDPSLNIQVYNKFSNETVANIILFLCKQYDLDINFLASIMSFYKYAAPPKPVPPAKEIKIAYNEIDDFLSLDLNNDSLATVVKKITQASNKNVLIAPGLLDKRISGYIQNMPFDNSLDKIAFANDLIVTKTEDGFYLIEKQEVEEITAGKKVYKSKYDYLRDKQKGKTTLEDIFIEVRIDTSGIKRITVEAVDIPIADIIKSVSDELQIDYFLYSEPKGNTTAKVTNATFDEFLYYLFRGTEFTFKKDSALYLIGERKLEGLRITKSIQLQFRSAEAIVDVIPAELKKGIEVKLFPELNSIILSGSSIRIDEVEEFIKVLDQVVPMVMIEVILVDLEKGWEIKTGISAGLADSVKSGGLLFPGLDFTLSSKAINTLLSGLSSGGSVNLGQVTPNFYVSLRALESQRNINVTSTPKLATLNGHEATLSIGKTIYYTIETQNVIGSLNPQTVITQQYNSVQANLTVTIKPVVSGRDQVTLDIDVEISDFLGDPPPNAPPPSVTSKFKSIVRVKNEEMIVLGGLERISKSDAGSGFPILSRIPVIKWFFSTKTNSKKKSKSIIFIKPTIVY